MVFLGPTKEIPAQIGTPVQESQRKASRLRRVFVLICIGITVVTNRKEDDEVEQKRQVGFE
jgi:hypothetical protein